MLPEACRDDASHVNVYLYVVSVDGLDPGCCPGSQVLETRKGADGVIIELLLVGKARRTCDGLVEDACNVLSVHRPHLDV